MVVERGAVFEYFPAEITSARSRRLGKDQRILFLGSIWINVRFDVELQVRLIGEDFRALCTSKDLKYKTK